MATLAENELLTQVDSGTLTVEGHTALLVGRHWKWAAQQDPVLWLVVGSITSTGTAREANADSSEGRLGHQPRNPRRVFAGPIEERERNRAANCSEPPESFGLKRTRVGPLR